MNIKKISFFVFLGAASILLVNGCGPLSLEEKTVTVKEFSFIDLKEFDGFANPQKLTLSRDGKSIYATVNGDRELFYGDASDAAKEVKWKEIPLQTNLPDGAGEAKLENSYKVTNISPAQDGAMVSVRGEAPAGSAPGTLADNGAFYISGSTHKAAWASNAKDLNALGHGVAPANDRFANNAEITAFLVQDKDGKDVPYFWGEDSLDGSKIAMTKPDLTAAIANALIKKPYVIPVLPFVPIPYMASGGDYIFAVISGGEINLGIAHGIVKYGGITVIPRTDVGTRKDFPDVQVATPPDAATGVVGSDSFKMKAPTANNIVQAVTVFGNNLYIGFQTVGDFSGGVAVYHIKEAGTAPEISAPDKVWSGISVTGFIQDASGVWAVTNRDIFKVTVDNKLAKKGPSYFDGLELANENFDEAKDGYDKNSFPQRRDIIINGAILLPNGELMMATNRGMVEVKTTEKFVRSGKVAAK